MTIQATVLQRSRTLLLGKVKALHNIQDIYAGIADMDISTEPANCRQVVCVTTLVEQEDTLRNAQPDEVLHSLHAGLWTGTFSHKFKRKHMGGQGAYTKSHELLDGIEDHIHTAATRYRAAWAALLVLRGPGL
ncbi:hypothetical protein B0H14DRAFT_2621806 [Mycena olivaceomarginata]|nr:hypothetical protein B0H14DRAFT_2621806 [Mycena olivaceomarginata]